MSNIPMGAIHAAFTPVQRATNELIRARKVQAEKASHHTEDVEELDDTAVNSVDERQQNRGGQKERGKGQDEPEEKVDIAALNDVATPAAIAKANKLAKARPQLDISA